LLRRRIAIPGAGANRTVMLGALGCAHLSSSRAVCLVPAWRR
jgi:hypothetical protein